MVQARRRWGKQDGIDIIYLHELELYFGIFIVSNRNLLILNYICIHQ